jgi:hypothetical protein
MTTTHDDNATTSHDLADLPVPPGARPDAWQQDAPPPYRVQFGELRAIDGLDIDCVNVQATAVQLSDGRIDNGSVYEPPHVYLWDDGMSPAQARGAGRRTEQAADGADRWAADVDTRLRSARDAVAAAYHALAAAPGNSGDHLRAALDSIDGAILAQAPADAGGLQ